MFHIALTMGYVKRNILHENASKPTVICKEEMQSAFMGADSTMGETFTTTAQVPVLRLYQFLTSFTVQSGPDKGKPILDGNAVSDKDFIRSVMRADYSMIYANGVKGKLRCISRTGKNTARQQPIPSVLPWKASPNTMWKGRSSPS